MSNFKACRVLLNKSVPTKRAPDAGDSAHIPNSFTRLIIFLAGRLRRPRPSAGNANRWAVPCKMKVHFMKFSKALLPFFLIICICCSGCNSSSGKIPDYQTLQEQDKACRQTIQNRFSIEYYCPNNLKALKSLYTDSYNQYFLVHPLDSCTYISSYKILKLLSSSDPNYPKFPNISNTNISNNGITDGFLMYYAEVEMNIYPGKPKPTYNPEKLWITMQMDKSGECKIDFFSGGG